MKPSEQIDKHIASFTDWRGTLYTQLRNIVNETDSNLKEEWKWGTAVWTLNGMVCAVSAFKDHVKINFFKGSQLKDKHKLINAGLDSKNHRAIDFSENDQIKVKELKDLIQETIDLNIKK